MGEIGEGPRRARARESVEYSTLTWHRTHACKPPASHHQAAGKCPDGTLYEQPGQWLESSGPNESRDECRVTLTSCVSCENIDPHASHFVPASGACMYNACTSGKMTTSHSQILDEHLLPERERARDGQSHLQIASTARAVDWMEPTRVAPRPIFNCRRFGCNT